MDIDKIRYFLGDITERILFPFAGFIILYCLVHPLIITFEYIRVIQFFILIISVVFLLCVVISKEAKGIPYKNIRWTILKWIFFCYFFVYYVFQLYTMSVYYNYLVVLLYGLVVGYRLRKS